MRKPDIDPPIKSQIDKILDRSSEFYKSGNIPEALKLAHHAWDLIPEPKFKWDYYPQDLSVGFVEDYASLKDETATKSWIKIAYQAYGDENRESIYILFVEARALFDLGLREEAYFVFDRIYELSGERWFKEEDAKFLLFYLDERERLGLANVK